MAQSRELADQAETTSGFADSASVLATSALLTAGTPGATGCWVQRKAPCAGILVAPALGVALL